MRDAEEVVAEVVARGPGRRARLAVAVAPGVGLGLAWTGTQLAVDAAEVDPLAVVAGIEAAVGPRWTWWDAGTATTLLRGGVRVATCWDLAAVHRLLVGGWRADPGRVWAHLHGLATDTLPARAPVDLFNQPDAADADPQQLVRPDGHLRPSWVEGGWTASAHHLAAWAAAAGDAADRQEQHLRRRPDPERAAATARSESTAELLGAELSADGLPLDRGVAESIVASSVGARPRSDAEAAEQRARRDELVLRHVPPGGRFDLRSPGQVRSLLRFVGIEVPDTRAWRLEAQRGAHPVVDALLTWRKAERVATTYGYAWLDDHVDDDGRLRGAWSGSDGAAGRMTASAGLHNLPTDLRPAVVAEPGRVLVRADLGQIEPRVLAAVSGDPALARATQDDDLYLPVARQLGVDRATAKVAVLGALYGQTTGHGAAVLPRLRSSYPVAMEYLDTADRAGQAGRDLITFGGRVVRTASVRDDATVSDREARSRAAARGRFGRNALVQGAAAELFKAWAATVRARVAHLDARIVLCLHDELLVHAPVEHGAAVAAAVDDALQEAAARWAPDRTVRFLAATSVIARWSDAKD